MVVREAELSIMEFVGGSMAFNGLKSCAKASIAQREHVCGGGVDHTGKRTDFLRDLLIETGDVRITLVADARERKRNFEAMINVKAQRHVAQGLKTPHHQNRSGEQHHRAGNL